MWYRDNLHYGGKKNLTNMVKPKQSLVKHVIWYNVSQRIILTTFYIL